MGAKRAEVRELQEVRELLRHYGLGCPELESEEDVRGWLATLGQRFACHFAQTTGKQVRCEGWGPLHRRGTWLHPLTFSVGRTSYTFYLSLLEMQSLHQAHPDHQLAASERLYQWLERLLDLPQK